MSVIIIFIHISSLNKLLFHHIYYGVLQIYQLLPMLRLLLLLLLGNNVTTIIC